MAILITAAMAGSPQAFVPGIPQGTANAAPAAPSAGYVQAEATAVRDLVCDLRQALINAGIIK